MQQPNTLKSLQIMHKAMLIGPTIFAVIAIVLVYNNSFIPSLPQLDKTLQLIVIAISFAAVFIGSSVLKKKVQQARSNNGDAATKMKLYRSACLIQWPLLEGAALFCIVCFLLVGNLAYIALAGVLLIWLALAIPSKTKLMILLGLTEKEMEEI